MRSYERIVLAMILCSISILPLSAQLTVGGFLNFNIAGLSVKPAGTGEDYSSYLGFGGGVGVPYDNLIFFAETRYVFGLSDINQESGESKAYIRGLQILLGAKVPLVKP